MCDEVKLLSASASGNSEAMPMIQSPVETLFHGLTCTSRKFCLGDKWTGLDVTFEGFNWSTSKIVSGSVAFSGYGEEDIQRRSDSNRSTDILY